MGEGGVVGLRWAHGGLVVGVRWMGWVCDGMSGGWVCGVVWG
jgi:hypothetical protein